MQSPTARHLFPKIIYLMAGALYYLLSSQIALAQSSPVTISFDNLPTGTLVSNQYPQVSFSSENNFYYPPYASSNCGPCVTSSAPNFVTSGTGFNNGNHEVILSFTQPVKNLSFYTVAEDNFNLIYKIDVWENGTLARTVNVTGNGASYYPVYTDLRQFGNSITKIRIYNITDVNGLGFDDINFTPVDVQAINITNSRVSGSLNNTTQTALLAADVRLQANTTPAGLTGGTYSWNITGPYQIVSGATNQSSLTLRWTQTGT